MQLFFFILQATAARAEPASRWDAFMQFIDSPAPYSPLSEYLLVLFLLWLLARRDARRQGNFGRQAQDVLDDKLAQGEISQKSYDKYRQEISLRPKN